MDKLLRINDAAKLAGVGRSAIEKCIERGKLRSVRRHGVTLIRASDIVARWPEGKPLEGGGTPRPE